VKFLASATDRVDRGMIATVAGIRDKTTETHPSPGGFVSRLAGIYIALVVAAGAAALGHGVGAWGLWSFDRADQGRFFSWCLITLAASGMKVQLPSVSATMSLNFLFVLIGIAEFNPGEAMVMGCLGVLAQCIIQAKSRLRWVQVAFSVCSVACSIQIACWVHHARHFQSYTLTAATYFLANTIFVATVIALTEQRNLWKVWRDSYLWSFPNYLVGAAGAWVIGIASHLMGWQSSLLLLPILYVVYRSHNMYVGRLEEARKGAERQRIHAEEVAALHRRTIETLALAIEAKDQTTHDHLERVETYAIEVGRELGMTETELEALRAAALLHDIGKIAVPEYIISKPGKLTPEEFDRMKTHTVVGAEIVERMRFPYTVAPLVRGHHEKWNGKGYPDGLSGEEIPLGARILAAVDCLDALSSDRQYRRALPLPEAIAVVKAEAGKSFDPRVVDILARRYEEIAALVSGEKIERLPVCERVERGDSPATGFERTSRSAGFGPGGGSDSVSVRDSRDDLASLNQALGGLQRTRELPALIRSLTQCKDCAAAFGALQTTLPQVISHETMTIYLRRDQHLIPEFFVGGEYRSFGSHDIPIGTGLSGWVAENCKAIVNGNPMVEPGYLADPAKFRNLRSALAVPLTGAQGVLGVMALYHCEGNAFDSGDLAALTSIGAALSAVLGSSPVIASAQARDPQPLGAA